MPPSRNPPGRTFDKRAILRDHPIFGGLGLELLDRLSSYAVRRTVKRGTSIFAKGDPGTSLLAVCSGTVKISAPSPSGKGALFNLMTEGEIFGEVALLDGLPRTADATAITDCELMVIERRNFVPLVHERPDFALKLIELLCGRLRHTSEQLEDVMFLDLPGRLARALLQLAKNSKPAPRGRRIALTQRHLSEIIGISRERTNKQLRIWQQQKWILLERAGITILAPDKLAAAAAMAGDE
jgi:CRP/FNR family cyclic AMP-dependent transcriptional regulator